MEHRIVGGLYPISNAVEERSFGQRLHRIFGRRFPISDASEERSFGFGRRLQMQTSVSGVGLWIKALAILGPQAPAPKLRPPSILEPLPPAYQNLYPPPGPPPPTGDSGFQSLDWNVVIIMVVLLFALICAALMNSMLRYMLRRRARQLNANAVFLGREMGQASDKGLDAKTLASLPVLTFKESDNPPKQASVDCTICLCEFAENERLILLPKCSHVFHLDCIDMWLLSHASCPVCRDDIAGSASVALDVDQAANAGEAIILTRDQEGNPSVRTTTAAAAAVAGVNGNDETVHTGAELQRDKSWNTLSDARITNSGRKMGLSGRDLSMPHLGSSRRYMGAELQRDKSWNSLSDARKMGLSGRDLSMPHLGSSRTYMGAKLQRDKSWNSLSDARITNSGRKMGLNGRDLSMPHLGSSRRSLRAALASIIPSDKFFSGRWQASSSSVAGATGDPASALAPSRPHADGGASAAEDELHLRAAASTSPDM